MIMNTDSGPVAVCILVCNQAASMIRAGRHREAIKILSRELQRQQVVRVYRLDNDCASLRAGAWRTKSLALSGFRFSSSSSATPDASRSTKPLHCEEEDPSSFFLFQSPLEFKSPSAELYSDGKLNSDASLFAVMYNLALALHLYATLHAESDPLRQVLLEKAVFVYESALKLTLEWDGDEHSIELDWATFIALVNNAGHANALAGHRTKALHHFQTGLSAVSFHQCPPGVAGLWDGYLSNAMHLLVFSNTIPPAPAA